MYHRIAVYIEQYINKTNFINDYYVDVEYNKNSHNEKILMMDKKEKVVIPDIIVHKRRAMHKKIPHYLVIEAKKHKESFTDIKKVKSFIEDNRYNYLFGLTVVYGEFNPIKAKLFYFKNGKIFYE